tara:strand:+ start:1938 stop:2522 length:585 start_codon:yes stop_codon:yes gene_type:complete
MNQVIQNIVNLESKIFDLSSVVLDVGTGGFLGANSIDHYKNLLLEENIYCIEIKKEPANLLKNKYKNSKITCLEEDFFLHVNPDGKKYDTIFMDIDTNVFTERFPEIVNKSKTLLKKNGYLIQMTLGSIDDVRYLTNSEKIIKYFKNNYKNLWNTDNILTSNKFKDIIKNKFVFLKSFEKPDYPFINYAILQNI